LWVEKRGGVGLKKKKGDALSESRSRSRGGGGGRGEAGKGEVRAFFRRRTRKRAWGGKAKGR